ncbi:MAG: transaldolase family protein [Candidatus Andeanibacterium colombiense]|uniref:Transaldolase family protein n=1 Tax=Candidatus Andeanibacterium colombiense TaxID=3121345 RepID=A0AAJ5X888_9SPHN|nr:MAG: transaldolase family protein [Sphingomonadaceae bacterium]
MTQNVLEKLAATNPGAEIWWDSSPLIYPSWKAETLAKAPAGKEADWEEQLTRLYDEETIRTQGTMGFRGVTTNPPLSLQAVKLDPAGWTKRVQDIAKADPALDVESVYWAAYLDLVKLGADAILPVYEKSGGKYGFLSGQVDPRFVRDGEAMLKQGLSIYEMGENVMVKLPGSKEGYEVLEELTARGISTNNTTSFTVPQYMRCMAAVSAGLLRATAAGVDLSKWRSVITHMSARLGELSDWKIEAKARGIELTLPEIRDGEEAVLKRAYHFGKSQNHPSKMLQCSMRVEKDERTGKLVSRHIQDYAGSDMVYTCPPGYIAGLMQAEDELEPFDANAIDREPNKASIEKLLKLPSFRQAYEYDGMTPDQFSQFGSFQATATEFAAATRQTVDFAAMVMGK